jgi:hypothetical protein
MSDKERLGRVERALGEIVYSSNATGVGSERVLARLARTAPASAELLDLYLDATEPIGDSLVVRRETPEIDRPALEHRKEAA